MSRKTEGSAWNTLTPPILPPARSSIFSYQIAHLIAQLIERGSLFRRAFPTGVGSAKNIAFRLLEAWRNLRLSTDQIQQMLDARLQIRFAPP